MTIEVNTNFVLDRLIYAGMEKETAENDKDVFAVFNAANTDGDNKISESEYAEYLKKSCSIELKTIDVICTKASAPRHYRKDLLENRQVDFYPDLKLGNIPKDARNIYNLIDLDKNKILSSEELQKFNKARDLLEKTKQEIIKKCDKHGKKNGVAGLTGLTGALGGAYFALDGISIAGTFLGCIGPAGWVIAGVSALGAAGYMLYESHSYSKECQKIEQKLLKQTDNHPYVLEHIKDFKFYYD